SPVQRLKQFTAVVRDACHARRLAADSCLTDCLADATLTPVRRVAYALGVRVMARRLLPAILVAALAVAGAAAQQQRPRIPPTGAIKKLHDNLYVIPGAGGNTTVFVTEAGVVLVDIITKEELLTDMEYGGTPLSRAVINVNVAFQELGNR